MAQTPTDPRTAGNNDKLWDEVTEDENLQHLLYEFMTLEAIHTEAFRAPRRLQEWLGNNIRGCAAIIHPGRMYLSNGDPGYPDEYCENPVGPECGEYCEDHAGWEE